MRYLALCCDYDGTLATHGRPLPDTVEALERLVASGRRLIVINPDEMKDDLVRDMIEVLTSFCARLYGRGSSRNRAKKAVEAIEAASE